MMRSEEPDSQFKEKAGWAGKPEDGGGNNGKTAQPNW